MKKTCVPLIAGLLAITSPSLAAQQQGDFSFSPVVGIYGYADEQNLDTSMILGARAGYNFTEALTIEAVFDFVHTEIKPTSTKIDMYRYGGDLLYHFNPEAAFVPYVAIGFSGIKFDDSQNNLQGVFDYGAGAKYFVHNDFALRADFRHLVYNHDPNYSNFEFTVGAYIPFGAVKPAAKPVEPPPAPAPAPEPPPVVKPVEPPPAPVIVPVPPPAPTPVPEPAPAPKPVEPPPVPVAKPVEPPPAPVVAPVEVPPVPTPVPVAVPVVSVESAKAAERFCSKPAVIAIQFDSGKSDIKEGHAEELKVIGTFLKEFPSAKGEISGHTDNSGSKELNMKISQRRADSIKKYLVETFGISEDRIIAKGYGPNKPVADNKTAQGKAQNRRIEAQFSCQ